MYSRAINAWSDEPLGQSLRDGGLSAEEGIAVVVALCVLVTLAIVQGAAPAIQHSKITEALTLSLNAKVALMEQWAISGELPGKDGAGAAVAAAALAEVAAAKARDGNRLGKYVEALDPRAYDGSVLLTFHDQQHGIGGQTLQFRPAFGPGEAPATLVWVCGRAPLSAVFTYVGTDRTTLADTALPSMCRAPP
jgi:hypothetical protein